MRMAGATSTLHVGKASGTLRKTAWPWVCVKLHSHCASK